MVRNDKGAHVLVIRLSAMGDVAMLLPVLSSIIESNPALKITLLTKAHFSPIFNSFPNLRIVEADLKGKHKGLLGLFKLYKELKKLGITSVADVHNVLRSNILKLFFSFGNIPFVQIDKGRKQKAALTRTSNKDFKQLKTTQQRYADVFEKLGYPIDLSKTKLLARHQLSEKSIRITGFKNQRWIGIAPFAAHKGKMYPLHLMEKVIAELSKVENYKILLFGGGVKEVELLSAIENQFKPKVVSMAGKLSFSEELNVISNLDLMLSMDSGNGHLAANYGIPVITLWGVTHPYAGFAPFGQPEENALTSDIEKYPMIPTSIYGNKVPQGYEKVMETISPNKVAQKVVAIISS